MRVGTVEARWEASWEPEGSWDGWFSPLGGGVALCRWTVSFSTSLGYACSFRTSLAEAEEARSCRESGCPGLRTIKQ